MIGLLVTLLVVCLVIGLIWYVVDAIPVPDPLNRIAKIWTEGNYAELARFETWCSCLDTAAERAAMKRMLDDRNPSLAASIDKLHAGGQRVFAAVGSLHMIGPTGLPTLLRQRGYRVEQGDFTR